MHVHPHGGLFYQANRNANVVDHGGEKVFAGGEDNRAVFAIDQRTGDPTADPERGCSRHAASYLRHRSKRGHAGGGEHQPRPVRDGSAPARFRPVSPSIASAVTASSPWRGNTMQIPQARISSGAEWLARPDYSWHPLAHPNSDASACSGPASYIVSRNHSKRAALCGRHVKASASRGSLPRMRRTPGP